MSKETDPGSPDGHDVPDGRPDIFIDATTGPASADNTGAIRPSTRRWAAVGIAIVLVFFIGVAVGSHIGSGQVSESGGHSHTAAPADTTTSPAPTSPSHPVTSPPAKPDSPAATIPATNMLVPGNGVGGSASDGLTVVVLGIHMQNISDRPLVVDGPILLRVSSGLSMPYSVGYLIAGWESQPGGAPQAPLRSIAPHQQVQIVVTVDADCTSRESVQSWLDHSPTVVIPFAGFSKPWTSPLTDLLTGPDRLSYFCRTADAAPPTTR